MIHPIIIYSDRTLSDGTGPQAKARKRLEIIQEAKRLIMERSEKNMFSEPHTIPKVYY